MDIQAKIRALLAKTTENGASEAEALSAAEKARQLMDKYNVDLTETEAREQGVIEVIVTSLTKKYDQSLPMAMGIAQFCDCKVITNQKIHVLFIGAPQDAHMAADIFRMMRDARGREWKQWRKTNEYQLALFEANNNPNVIKRQFDQSFGHRISERFKELKLEQSQKLQKTTGTALVVVKDAQVTEYMQTKYPRLYANKSGRLKKGGVTARQAGRSAANRTSLQKSL